MDLSGKDALKIQLSSGRALAYRELGSLQGVPVVFFHGFPGSSVQATIVEDKSVYEPYRLIAVDRPGFGDSDFDPERTFVSFARDVGELLGSIGVERFHVLAVSGGSPYGFACAHVHQERVISVNSVSGLGPLWDRRYLNEMKAFLRLGLIAAASSPRVSAGMTSLMHKLFIRAQKKERSEEDGSMKLFMNYLAPADRVLISDAKLRASFRGSMTNSFRQGPGGSAKDLQLMTQDWGFALGDLRMPVRLWHGGDDTIVPASHSRLLAEHIKHAELRILEGEGHYSVPLRRLDLIMKPIR